MDGPAPILLYDGACGLCARSVQFILARDAGGSLRFATLDSTCSRSLAARHPELEHVDSVVWVDTRADRVWTRSAAAIRALAYLGGPWRLVRLALLVPPVIRDLVYRLVAAHRHALSAETCLVPTAAERSRFLD